VYETLSPPPPPSLSLSFFPLTEAFRLLPDGLVQPHHSSTSGLERPIVSILELEREA
jgi:hypothetical protein